jgi:hypothetical protein
MLWCDGSQSCLCDVEEYPDQEEQVIELSYNVEQNMEQKQSEYRVEGNLVER